MQHPELRPAPKPNVTQVHQREDTIFADQGKLVDKPLPDGPLPMDAQDFGHILAN